jgi:hypothetical protein
MSAHMSGNLVEIPQRAGAHQGSLAERMARSPLSLVEALHCGTEIAAALRDLHRQGLAYGAVSSQLIELGPSGATLRPTGVRQHMGDGRGDVAAFGAVLDEMLLRAETAGGGLDCLREKARALALGCRNESTGMQHVLIALRLLAIEARQCGAGVRPAQRPAVVEPISAAAPAKSAAKPTATPVVAPSAKSAATVATPAATPVTPIVKPTATPAVTPAVESAATPVAKPEATPATPVATPRVRVRVRIRIALHWKPLASLAAACARAMHAPSETVPSKT